MSIDEWLKEYDRLVEERDALYEREQRSELEDMNYDLMVRLGEQQTDNAYELRDLADEAATLFRDLLESEGLRPDGTRE